MSRPSHFSCVAGQAFVNAYASFAKHVRSSYQAVGKPHPRSDEVVKARAGLMVPLAMTLGLAACSSDDNAPRGGATQAGMTGNSSPVAGAAGSAGGGVGGRSGAGGSSEDVGGTLAIGGAAGAGTGPAGGNGGGGSTGLGGTGLSAGAGGAGGTAAYAPCPTDGNPCKILPFGDSITYGDKSSDEAGYRSQLFKLIVAAKQKVTFIGSRANGPTQVSGQPFPRTHEGHPGWTIDPGYNSNPAYGGISSLVPSPALGGGPHIILLHIGTNDLFARDTQNMATRLEALLDKIVQNAPSALIVLAQITPRGTSDAALTAYNSKIPGIVEVRAAKGQHFIGVDMSQLPVPADLYSDGTHPNDQGYAYMAGIWYAAIKDLLPK